jgi:hypothetical protein
LQIVGFTGAGGDDGSFGFAAEHVGPVGCWVEAGAEVAGEEMLELMVLQLIALWLKM